MAKLTYYEYISLIFNIIIFIFGTVKIVDVLINSAIYPFPFHIHTSLIFF
jgi:hypothetical protein